jgi:hypothetical protein
MMLVNGLGDICVGIHTRLCRRLGLRGSAGHLHRQDEFAINLGHRNSYTHVQWVDDSVAYGREGWVQEELSGNWVIVVRRGAGLLRSSVSCSASCTCSSRLTLSFALSLSLTMRRMITMAPTLTPNLTSGRIAATLLRGTTNASTTRVLENGALSNSKGDLSIGWDAHLLHHTLNADNVDW